MSMKLTSWKNSIKYLFSQDHFGQLIYVVNFIQKNAFLKKYSTYFFYSNTSNNFYNKTLVKKTKTPFSNKKHGIFLDGVLYLFSTKLNVCNT